MLRVLFDKILFTLSPVTSKVSQSSFKKTSTLGKVNFNPFQKTTPITKIKKIKKKLTKNG